MSTSNFGLEVYRRSQSSQLIDAQLGRTYQATDIARVATMLRAAGLRPGEFLVVCCGIDPVSALIYLGAIYGGIVPIPIADTDQERYLCNILAATGARHVWTKHDSNATECFPAELKVIRGLSTDGREPMDAASTAVSELAVLMPTSGSTGHPKLVQVTHENLLANSQAIVHRQSLASHDRSLLILPISYCFGASVLHTHLLAGGDIVFDRRMMFPDKVLATIEQFDCTTFAAVPSVFRTLLQRPRFLSNPPATLRKIFQAGGPLERQLIERIRELLPAAEFFVMYGQTEATARISILDPADFYSHPDSVGKPLANVTLRIVSETGRDSTAGEVGEIWVRGASVTNGYWHDSEGTGAKFVDGWLRTGDLGRLDEDGFLTISGRVESFVKVRGVRVALGDVETTAQQFPEVQEAAACGVPNAQYGEAVALFLVLAPGVPVGNALIKLRNSLPPQWAVQTVFAVAELPKTSSNKINRSQLQEMAKRVAA